MNNVNLETYENLKHELDLFFGDNSIEEEDTEDDNDDVDQDDSRTEQEILNGRVNDMAVKADTVKTAIQNFFTYSEKPFEEDDISNFEGIGINEPADDHKERKCYACNRRFMLNDSFDDHMKECILTKLFSFITDCHQLSVIKKHKAISAQEFIRRMIFSVKNIVKSLAMSYRIMSRQTLSTNKSGSYIEPTIRKDKDESKNFFDLNKRVFHAPELKTPIVLPKYGPKLINNSSGIEPQVIKSKETSQIFPKPFNFVAKCPTCQQMFNSIQSLETHNQELHNSRSAATNSTATTSSVSSLDSFSVFSGERTSGNTKNSCNTLMDLLKADDYSHEGIVDVIKLRQKSPKIVNINLKDYHE